MKGTRGEHEGCERWVREMGECVRRARATEKCWDC